LTLFVPVLGGLRQPNGLDHVLVWLFALAALADICLEEDVL